MSETTTPTVKARKRGRFGLWMLLSVALLALIAVVGVLGLTGRPLPAPDWVVSRIETRANGAIAGQGRVAIGGVELVVDREFVPRVRLRDVNVFTPGGVNLAQLPELRLTLKPQPLLRGKVEVRRIRLQDARVFLARDASGDFGLDLRMPASGPGLEVGSVAEVLDAVDRTFELPLLRGIERIEAEGLDITLEDRMSGQFWRVSDGRMTLTQDTRDVTIALGFDLAGADGAPASAEMSF
ncbi:MAG: AsmA family protein, partial [Paracoccaceae bacterium]